MNSLSLSEEELHRYQHLWDGTENWVLRRLSLTHYALRIQFGASGPSNAQIFALRKLLPDFRHMPLHQVTQALAGLKYYEIDGVSFAKMQVLDDQAKQLNLDSSQKTYHLTIHVPILVLDGREHALIIDDDHLADAIIQKMLAANVPVIDRGEFKR